MEENKSSIGEWIFCFILGAIFVWIGKLLFKPFEESNIVFKFLGILSIVFLLFSVFVVGLTALGTNPLGATALVVPGLIYGAIAIVSFSCRKVNE
jgi:hypothetical protein